MEAEHGIMLLGDEAVALGALHAGASAAYAYPGTPSTEILECLIPRAEGAGIVAHWCANEKTAYEQALGVSMMGRRALVAMKHVGLNVAMDPFVNSALVGLGGGLVVAVGDDPGMHSSQNEQDSRILADFARVPCLEPADQQQVYDMTREAFDLSERFGLPVMVRLVTRLCHSRAVVVAAPARPQNPLAKTDAPQDWTLLPHNARRLWRRLLDRLPAVREWAEQSPYNALSVGDPDAPFAVITSGIARHYFAAEAAELGFRPSHLHVGAYPPPEGLIGRLAAGGRRLLVIEEGYPFLERQVRGVLPHAWDVTGRESPPTWCGPPSGCRPGRTWARPRLPCRAGSRSCAGGVLTPTPTKRCEPLWPVSPNRWSPRTSAATRSALCPRTRPLSPACAWGLRWGWPREPPTPGCAPSSP
jgi:indolepyruvate ferredoxin oxidoreductase alpha subunit